MNSTEEPVETEDAGRPCGITSIFPIGMSCRGRAEAFARRLQSRLRTLGSQDSPLTSPNDNENTWLTHTEQENDRSTGGTAIIQSYQPIRLLSTATNTVTNEPATADSYYDFDIEPDELESPGSPIDECEYTRLIETSSATPNESTAPESGYVCASPCSSSITRSNTAELGQLSSQSSQSSSEGQQYFDLETSDNEHSKSLSTGDYFDCMEFRKEAMLANISAKPTTIQNGHTPQTTAFTSKAVRAESSDSCSDSLPPSQSTDSNLTWTHQQSSNSNSTLQDEFVAGSIDEENVVAAVDTAEPRPTAVYTNGEVDEVDSTVTCPSGHGCPAITFKNENEEISHLKDHENLKFIADITAPSKNVEKEDNSDQPHLTTVVEEDDDLDDEFARPPRVQRCSSLKTGKTPPGTPGRKKIVRFADVLGLDLADVRTFLDEVPNIPKYVYEDLVLPDEVSEVVTHAACARLDKVLMPLFQQPSSLADFIDKVREKQVCLENACVADPISMSIIGSVRVRNLDFHKSVHIRYTLDKWRSFSDLQANYVDNSCDGFSDRYSFLLFANSLKVGDRLEMAVRFQCKGQQFWDSNYGANYCFQCLPATPASQSQGQAIVVNDLRPKTADGSRDVEPWEGAFY